MNKSMSFAIALFIVVVAVVIIVPFPSEFEEFKPLNLKASGNFLSMQEEKKEEQITKTEKAKTKKVKVEKTKTKKSNTKKAKTEKTKTEKTKTEKTNIKENPSSSSIVSLPGKKQKKQKDLDDSGIERPLTEEDAIIERPELEEETPTIKETQTVDETPVVEETKYPTKGFVVGNSLTIGFGTHGMASTNVDTDYYYLLNQYLISKNPNYNMTRIAGNSWENNTDSSLRHQQAESIVSQISSDVDLVIIQLGDNISGDEKNTLYEDGIELVSMIEAKAPNARILWVYGIFNIRKNASVIEQICNDTKAEWVDTRELASDSKYAAYIGYQYYDSKGELKEITGGGVAAHPSDEGMRLIYEKIVSQLNY